MVVMASMARETPMLMALDALASPSADPDILGSTNRAILTASGTIVITVNGSEIMS